MVKRQLNSFFNRNVFKVNTKYSKPPRRLFFWTVTLFVIALIIFSFLSTESKWLETFRDLPALFSRFKEMFKWNWDEFTEKNIVGTSFLGRSLASIWVTIIMAFAGTLIGTFIAVPIAIMASTNIVKNKVVNNGARIILAIFRTIPAFVYALLLVNYFGQTTFTVTLALIIFTFSISGKTLYERIEQVNTQIYTTARATGASKNRSFRVAVWPQISHHVLAITFYSLETNIRYISIIAGVTKLGIGQMINDQVDLNSWDRVGFLITLLVLVVLTLEILIWIIRNYIIEDKDSLLDQKVQGKYQKQISKIKQSKNLDYYLEHIVAKKINFEIKECQDSKLLQSLKKTKKTLIKDFKKQHQQSIESDKKAYRQKLQSTHSQISCFVKSKELGYEVRLDKVYLSEFNAKVEVLKAQQVSELKTLASQEHQEFLESLTPEMVLRAQPKNYIKRFILYAIIFILFAYSLSQIQVELANKETIIMTNKSILKMFQISWASFFGSTASGANTNAPMSVAYLLFETLSIAVVGTFIGAVFAYCLGMLSSEKIVNKYVARIFIALTSILRAVPTYIYAILFIVLVGIGPFTGILALIMGTIGMLTKYNREQFDDINVKIIAQLEATGVNWLGKWRYGIVSQTSSIVISNIIYRFEINFKEVVMLGAVGAGNMGYLLNAYFRDQYFHEFGALLFGIILFTLLIENISVAMRRKVNNNTNLKVYDKLKNWIDQHWAITYRANEKYFGVTTAMTFAESKAFYAYSSQVYFRNYQTLKSALKLSQKDLTAQAWNKTKLEVCQELGVSVPNTNEFEQLKTEEHLLWTEKRKQLKQDMQTKIHDFKEQLKQAKTKSAIRELKKAIWYTKTSTQIQLSKLEL